VALPTETVYGLAADALNIRAIRQIFEIKKRPFYDPLIVHVTCLKRLLELVELDAELLSTVSALVEAFLPGPLTYVLPKKSWVPDLVTSGQITVAVRIPQHPLFQEVMIRSKCFIAAPSANPFGYISPTSASHVSQSLGGQLRYILDGGDCQVGVESTIIDLSRPTLRILRPGKITREEIQSVLPRKEIEYYTAQIHDNPVQPSAPGLLRQHYSPKTPLYLFSEVNELPLATSRNIARVFLSRGSSIDGGPDDFFLSEDGNLEVIARQLFALLRTLDHSHRYEKIYCQCPSPEGLGVAIADRLRRAALPL
jgi:L-threonylcarbamoyladenylate synthase